MGAQPEDTLEISASAAPEVAPEPPRRSEAAAEEVMGLAPPASDHRPARFALYGGMLLLGAGALVLYLGYDGAATTTAVAAQMPYIASGGLAGVGLLVLGGIFVALYPILAAQARMRADLRTLAEAIREMTDALHGMGSPSGNGSVVALGDGSSYHRADCRLVSRGRGPRYLGREEAARRGLVPCRICRP